MGTAYTRQSSFSDGDTITAALFNDEYNQLLTSLSYASSGTTGHQHDGTAGEGGNVHTIGDQDFLNKIVADSTNNRWGVFVQVSSSAVEQIRISDGVISPVTDNDIDLGTSSLEFKDLFIDGTAHIDTLDVDVNATVAGTLGVTGALTGSSTIQGTTITATTAFVPDASDGAALGTSALEFSDLFLADGAVINFGDDQDVTITHVADTGILLSSTDQLQFGDSGTYIYQSADGVLDLVSDTEIELTATTIDINGAVAMDGAITGGTNNTISGELDAATLDISGNADIDGTTNLDIVDIDGAVQIDATVTVGVDDTGYDVKFFGDTASAYMLWDTSADDLILGGAARVVVPASGLVIGSTAVTSTGAELNILDGVTSTAAELNIIDGDTSATSTTLADADRVVVNDAGTMKQVALTDFETYFESSIDTFSTIDINGGSIDGATLGTNSAITQAVIDDIDLNGKVITMTGSASDTAVFTAGTNGTLSIVTTDAAAAAANIQITADGTVEIDSAGVLTLDSGAAINIEPASGSAILLDGTISVDAGVVTGATSITSTAFVGDITGDVTGTADLATSITASANNSTDETVYPTFVDGATGTQGLETDTGLTYNPSSGLLTISGELDAGSLDISGNADIDGTLEADAITVDGTTLAEYIADTSGAMFSSNTESGITVTYQDGDNTIDLAVDAAQTGITSIYATDLILGEDAQTAIDFGTANEIDFKVDNAARLTLTSGALYPVTDNQIDLGTSSLEFKDAFFDGTVTADAFAGPLTGNVTGNASGTAATVTGAAQSAITSLGTLSTLTVDNVIINGATIGHTGDIDLITVASGIATVAGEVSMTTLDIGGTNVTSTAAELNILDGVTSTAAELNVLDGITAVVGELNALDIGATAVGTAVASKAVILDSNKDYTGVRNLTISGELDAATLDISGAIDVAGTANLDVVDVDGAVNFAADVTFADGADIITASAGTSNFRAGVNAGNSIQSGGNYNVVVGDEAGTAITTGDNNTAVGYTALDANTTGGNGTAVGYNALGANTTGANNTAVGYSALGVNEDGAHLTAVGYGALDANTTASHNIAVGYDALGANTTGSSNVTVGNYALDANTVGNYNIGMGYQALSTNVSGSSNVALGYAALYANGAGDQDPAQGNYNVAIGHQTMNSNTTGYGNTATGYLALYTGTTGSIYNAAYGYQSLYYATGGYNAGVGAFSLMNTAGGQHNVGVGYQAGDVITSGGNNICIGAFTDPSANSSTHQIVIGYNITGGEDNQFTFGKASNTMANEFDTDADWLQSSDVRKKKDIEDAVLGLDFVNDLRPVTYEWKPNYEFPKDFAEYSEENHMTLNVRMHGLVAQEVKAALDKTGVERFSGWKEDSDGCQRISKEAFVIPLIKAVQELSAEVKELKEKLNA